MKKVEQIGGEAAFTYIVDPNPLGQEVINPEDLLTYVSLRAFPKNRSIIADDNSFNNFTEREVVEFVTTTEQNGDNYVTTNYLNIGGVNKTDEAFGIKQIDVKYGASLVPEVNITFIDSRGASVFNGFEYEDEGGLIFNSSTFSSFFKLPYPTYELTVKGFYGKAVSYCLHMKRFSSKFNAETGNFEIETEFIGYTFAFLADIMMKYVTAITNSDVGLAKLEEDNLISVTDLLQSFGQITRLTEGFKDSSEEYEKLKVLNSLINKLQIIQGKIGIPLSENTSTVYTNNITIPDIDNRKELTFVRDVGILNSDKDTVHEEYFKEIDKQARAYNEFIEKNITTYPYIRNYRIESFYVQTPLTNYNLGRETSITNIRKKVTQNEPNFSSDQLITVDSIKQKLQIEDENDFNFIMVDYYNIRKSINELITSLKDEKKKQEEIANKRLNKIIEGQLGFNPTIQEIFNIVIGNVDAFLSVIYDYAYKADSLGEQRTTNLNILNTDIPASSNKIFPFPAVINDNGENAWIGDIVGENNSNFPEIELVNKVIESLIYVTDKDNKAQSTKSLLQRLKLENDDWFPINPIDYTSNDYFEINNVRFQGTDIPEQLVEVILKRLLISYNYTRYGSNFTSVNPAQPNTSQLNLIAELEGSYAEHKIVDELVENIIATYDTNSFTDALFQKGLSSGIITESFNGIVLTENILNGYNFDSSLGMFISEDEPTIYNNITNNNVQKFAENQQNVINERTGKFEDLILKNKKYHGKINPRNYYIQRDFTDIVWSEEVQGRLKDVYQRETGIALVDDRPTESNVISYAQYTKLFDGFTVNQNTTQSQIPYLNNEHNNIGRNLTPLEYSTFQTIFDTPYYQEADNFGKALLLLKTFNFQSPNILFDGVQDVANISKFPKLYMLWVGANIYRDTTFKETGIDIINLEGVNFIQGGYLGGQEADIPFLTTPLDFSKYSEEVRAIFQEYFNKWTNNFFIDFEKTVKTYRNLGLTNITEDDSTYSDYKSATNELLVTITEVVDLVVLSPQKILNEDIRFLFYPNITETLLKNQIRLWHTSFKNFVKSTNLNPQPSSDFDLAPIFDTDFKIRVYNDFKEIYDKWISYGAKDGRVYNNCGFVNPVTVDGQRRDKRLIDHFHFIDRTWSYIGDKAVINPKSLLSLSEAPDINLYSYIGRILRESKFNFHVLPSYVNYYSIEEVSEMFEPQITVDNVNSGPTFVCMYVGGNSKVLDLGNQYYVNDGFDLREITKQDVPKGFTNRRTPAHLKDIKEEAGKYNMAAFRVSYADQNQNIFKSIQVTQEEHRNTGEFLHIMSDLFDNRGGTQRFYKGTDLYNLYAVRSYAASVTSMGNMQIQPLQYFQLDNIPMFHGAYMISDVSHRITAHNVETTFKGYRMPKVTYPIVETMTSYIQLPLSEVLDSEIFQNNVTFDNYGITSNGYDNTNEIAPSLVSDVTNSTRVLFDFGNTKYKLLPSLDEAQLNSNLERVFPTNLTNTYGLGKNLCYSWVKNVLADLGVVQTPASGIHAWTFFANLGDFNMKYFNNNKTNNFTNADLKAAGVKNGSFVFGFYAGSDYKPDAYAAINAAPNNATKTANLTLFRRSKDGVLPSNMLFNPITHVGIYYNDQFNHMLSVPYQHPTPNFYPIAHYEFLPRLKELSRE